LDVNKNDPLIRDLAEGPPPRMAGPPAAISFVKDSRNPTTDPSLLEMLEDCASVSARWASTRDIHASRQASHSLGTIEARQGVDGKGAKGGKPLAIPRNCGIDALGGIRKIKVSDQDPKIQELLSRKNI
jgi:hypothetical protein